MHNALHIGVNRHVLSDIDRILIDRVAIAKRVRELAEEICADLDALPEDVEIVFVPVLTGSIVFLADLIRELPQKLRIRVVDASSYAGPTTTSRGVSVGELPEDLRDAFVLIVDDILDSGKTIRRLREDVGRQAPHDVRICVLLRKEIPDTPDTPCEYVGFDIPNEFVVGYGLDYNNYYRNLPDIGVLKKEAM